MANYTTNADLVDDVLFRCSEPTDGTSDHQDAAVRYLNRCYQAIWRGGGALLPDVQVDWWWLRKYGSGQITMLPVFNAGTVQVANGSTTLTFSSAPARNAASISLQGAFFKTTEHADVFRITSHSTGSTSATIDSIYTGDDNTAATFRVMFLDYAVAADVLALISPMRVYQDDQIRIDGTSPDRLWQDWPLNECSSGVPHAFADVGVNASGSRIVRFSHYGGSDDDALIRIEYEYLFEPSTDIEDNSSEIEMPREWRHVLCDWATYFLLMDKEDTRAADVLKMAAGGLRAMAAADSKERARVSGKHASGIAGSFGKIMPRQQGTGRPRIMRTENGSIIG